MTSGEITTTVCGILPALAAFILTLRHGWAIRNLKRDAEYSCRAVANHEQRLTNVEKHTKCPDAAHVKHVSTADQIAKGIAAQHHIHRPSK